MLRDKIQAITDDQITRIKALAEAGTFPMGALPTTREGIIANLIDLAAFDEAVWAYAEATGSYLLGNGRQATPPPTTVDGLVLKFTRLVS